MDPNSPTPTPNPAADVANAAMNGATTVVTTTDLNAADYPPMPAANPVAPTPTVSQMPVFGQPLDTPADTTAAPTQEPADDAGSVNLTPSADFAQTQTDTATVSAAPADTLATPADPTSVSDMPDLSTSTDAQSQVVDQLAQQQVQDNTTGSAPVSDFTNQSDSTTSSQDLNDAPVDEEPLVAAQPVPGSIGSARSYADIQREEAEIAARVEAAKTNKGKPSKKIILLASVGILVLIGVIVTFIIASQPKTPATPNKPSVVVYEPEDSILSCKRSLKSDEQVFGSASGTQENRFYFTDDVLTGLMTQFAYTYNDSTAATSAYNFVEKDLTEDFITNIDNEYSYSKAEKNTASDNSEDIEDSETDSTKTKTVSTDLRLTSANRAGIIYTYRWRIAPANINNYLKSSDYSDEAYGYSADAAIKTTGTKEEDTKTSSNTTEEDTDDVATDGTSIERNLSFFEKAQKNIGYTCTSTK